MTTAVSVYLSQKRGGCFRLSEQRRIQAAESACVCVRYGVVIRKGAAVQAGERFRQVVAAVSVVSVSSVSRIQAFSFVSGHLSIPGEGKVVREYQILQLENSNVQTSDSGGDQHLPRLEAKRLKEAEASL